MKKNIFLKAMIIAITAFTFSLSSCDTGPNCPSGMVECEQQDGTTICVPDHIGC